MKLVNKRAWRDDLDSELANLAHREMDTVVRDDICLVEWIRVVLDDQRRRHDMNVARMDWFGNL